MSGAAAGARPVQIVDISELEVTDAAAVPVAAHPDDCLGRKRSGPFVTDLWDPSE